MTLKEKNWKIRTIDVGKDKFYGEKDVKEAVLHFEKYLNDNAGNTYLRDMYKKIFGDFK